MTLAYDRVSHQGSKAEFPRAGREIGEPTVETAKDGMACSVSVIHIGAVGSWGSPSWTVMGVPYIDGHTRAGRRTTVIVKTDDLHDEVRSSDPLARGSPPRFYPPLSRGS
jgi:hypothetical protein